MPFGISPTAFPQQEPKHWSAAGRPIRVYSIGGDRTRDWRTMLGAFGNDPRFEIRLICRWIDEVINPASFSNLEIPRTSLIEAQRDAYTWADLVIMPMFRNCFSGITVACEAVAMGVPVVSSARWCAHILRVQRGFIRGGRGLRCLESRSLKYHALRVGQQGSRCITALQAFWILRTRHGRPLRRYDATNTGLESLCMMVRRLQMTRELPALPNVEMGLSIPTTIYQTYNSALLTPAIISNIKQLKLINPGYRYENFDDKQVETFIRTEYGDQVLSRYNDINADYGAARADLFRYLLIYRRGGVYLDLKSTTVLPLAKTLRIGRRLPPFSVGELAGRSV